MIQGIVVGKGKVNELVSTRVRKPSEMELTILELAKDLDVGDRFDIDTKLVSYDRFAAKLGQMKKLGRISSEYGLRTTPQGFAFIRKGKAQKKAA